MNPFLTRKSHSVKCGLSSDDITVETVFDIFGNNKKSRCAVVEQ